MSDEKISEALNINYEPSIKEITVDKKELQRIKREKRERVEKIWDSYGKEMSKKYKRNIGSGITTTPHNVIDIKNNIIVPEKRNIRGFVKKSGSIVQPSIATRRVNLIKPKLKMRGR